MQGTATKRHAHLGTEVSARRSVCTPSQLPLVSAPASMANRMAASQQCSSRWIARCPSDRFSSSESRKLVLASSVAGAAKHAFQLVAAATANERADSVHTWICSVAYGIADDSMQQLLRLLGTGRRTQRSQNIQAAPHRCRVPSDARAGLLPIEYVVQEL